MFDEGYGAFKGGEEENLQWRALILRLLVSEGAMTFDGGTVKARAVLGLEFWQADL